jgi:hypothetical protein
MDIKELSRANSLFKEIRELERFISSAEKVWTGRLIKKTSKHIFRSNAYGAISEAEFHLNTDLKNKVLDVLRDHLDELKSELENL